MATELMYTLSTHARNKQPALNKSEWTELLHDLLTVRDQIFSCIPRNVCYQVNYICRDGILNTIYPKSNRNLISLQACAQSLLGSGNHDIINHCKQLLCSRSQFFPDKVPYPNAVELVVNAAKEYFNSANDVTDSCMKLAKLVQQLLQCLAL